MTGQENGPGPGDGAASRDVPTTPPAIPWQTQRVLGVLSGLGVDIPTSARVLDFGCGSGGIYQSLRRLGYVNAEGYDLAESSRLTEHRDHIMLGTVMNQRLPYEDDTFDVIISDQVFEHVQDQATTFRELYRVMRPGGHALHCIPARYMPVEGHIHVPFGAMFQHRWWYMLWATLGVRNIHQKGWTADRTADWNTYFAVMATRYVPTSCYRALWQEIGFEYRFAEQEFFDSHARATMRYLGKGGRPVAWLYRNFRGRWAYLRKPVTARGGRTAEAGRL